MFRNNLENLIFFVLICLLVDLLSLRYFPQDTFLDIFFSLTWPSLLPVLTSTSIPILGSRDRGVPSRLKYLNIYEMFCILRFWRSKQQFVWVPDYSYIFFLFPKIDLYDHGDKSGVLPNNSFPNPTAKPPDLLIRAVGGLVGNGLGNCHTPRERGGGGLQPTPLGSTAPVSNSRTARLGGGGQGVGDGFLWRGNFTHGNCSHSKRCFPPPFIKLRLEIVAG